MNADASNYPLCRHLKTNGHRCQSPALAGEAFCYFHSRVHKDHPAALTAQQIVNTWREGWAESMISSGEDPMQIARAYPRQNEFNFPPLEDAESIQFAASMLFHTIAQGHLHLSRARLLRDILRVACTSNRRAAAVEKTSAQIRRIEQTPEGVPIAPEDGPEAQSNDDFAANPSE